MRWAAWTLLLQDGNPCRVIVPVGAVKADVWRFAGELFLRPVQQTLDINENPTDADRLPGFRRQKDWEAYLDGTLAPGFQVEAPPGAPDPHQMATEDAAPLPEPDRLQRPAKGSRRLGWNRAGGAHPSREGYTRAYRAKHGLPPDGPEIPQDQKNAPD